MRKRVFSLALTLLLLFSLAPGLSATADNEIMLPLDGSRREGSLPAVHDRNRYKVELLEAGRLTVEVSERDGVTGGHLRSGRGNAIWIDGSGNILRSVRSGFGPYNEWMDLEAGIYYFEIERTPYHPQWEGMWSLRNYSIRGAFQPAGNNESEPNESFATAHPLSLGETVRGFISHQDQADIFRFEMPQSGRFSLSLTRDSIGGIANQGVDVVVFDSNGTRRGGTTSGFNANPYTLDLDLETGTYYIEIIKRASASSNTGTYDLTIQVPTAPVTKFTITATASPVNGGTVAGGGTFQSGASVTLLASPNNGWSFDGWYEGNTRVGTNVSWTFTAEANRAFIARFSQIITQPTIPNPHSDWAREELIRAIDEDLIPLSLIGPNVDLRLPISRAEFAGVAVKAYENLSGESIQPAGNNPFTDTWDVDVLRAFNAGIMVGVSPTQFDPNTTLNREQAATALTRVFKRWHFEGWSFATDANFPLQFARPAPFADDANISDWARESVYFMNANGIILGLGNNIFGPRAVTPDEQARGFAQATREQAILIALRMVENLG